MIINCVNPVPLSKYFKFANVSTPSPSFDYTKPQKHWVIGWGDVTGATFTYDCVTKGADGLPQWDTNTISTQDAMAANVPPSTSPSGMKVIAEIPTPINKQAVLAAGLELCTDFMTNPAFCVHVPVEQLPISFTQEDHDALMMIRVKLLGA
jgi:hypothetical protein